MKKIPENVSIAWNNRIGSAVFTTVSKEKIPNSIYVNSISKYNDSIFIIADNYFNKTRKNISEGSLGSILFMVSETEAFQIKGTIKYFINGPFFDDMKKWNNPKHPGHAVAVLEVDQVFMGGKKLL